MKLEHQFTVPAPVDEAWKVLLDVERIAPCMPGATLLTVDGEAFTGMVKVKVGPIQVTYKGEAKFAQLDEGAHRAVIEASGKEARGSGTAAATVTAVLTSAGPSSTTVQVETDLNVTGRPAQFGRGVMAEVGGKLIGQFANCLADELSQPSTPQPTSTQATASPAEAAAGTTTAAKAPAKTAEAPDKRAEAPAKTAEPPAKEAPPSQPRIVAPPRQAAEPIDLLDVAGGSVAKRVVPIAVALVVLLWLFRRRRR